MAILIIIGVSFGPWNSLVGILGISANILFEMIAMYFPSVIPHKYSVVIAIEVVRGLIPVIPDVEGGKMMVAAFVGTTMAAATFLSRPLFIQGKG